MPHPPTYHSLIYRFMSLPRDVLCLRAIVFCVLPCSRHLKDRWVCVFRCLNSSLSHTKHPRCLCINSAVPQGRHNTREAMCHLIRLGSQSKCSHAHLNGCLLLCNHLFYSPPRLQHTNTHIAHCHFSASSAPQHSLTENSRFAVRIRKLVPTGFVQ